MRGHVSTNGGREFDLANHKVLYIQDKIILDLYGYDRNDIVVVSLTVEDAIKLRYKLNTALAEAASKE